MLQSIVRVEVKALFDVLADQLNTPVPEHIIEPLTVKEVNTVLSDATVPPVPTVIAAPIVTTVPSCIVLSVPEPTTAATTPEKVKVFAVIPEL